MIKKILFTKIICAALLFSGCASLQNEFNKINPNLKQSFGDAIRSLEGAGIASIPAAVAALKARANQWLPQGSVYLGAGESLLGGAIKAFIAANPQTPADINSALEAVATTLQATP